MMSYHLPVVRRRRRRRTLWIVAVASLVMLLVLLAVQFVEDRTKTADYLDVARGTASTFEALSIRADTVVSGLEEADRPALLTVLTETSTEAAAAENALLEAEVPSDLASAAAFLTTAVAAWRDGISQLETGIDMLLEDPTSVPGSAALTSSFLDFRVGDRAYARFTVLVAESAGDRPFPDFGFVTPERELRYDAALVVRRLAALESLAPGHDIAIADVRFDPAPTGDREGRAVIPFSSTLNVEVSIVNRGNEPESDIPVRMRLVGLAGDIIDEEVQVIPTLEPGAAVNLLFADLPVQPGEFYEIVLFADLATDEDPTSNEYSESFYRNDST